MTVQQLIDQLQKLDPNLRVFTKGYEGGYEDADFNGRIRDFNLNYYKDWYMGPHEIIDDEDKTGTVKGIII